MNYLIDVYALGEVKYEVSQGLEWKVVVVGATTLVVGAGMSLQLHLHASLFG